MENTEDSLTKEQRRQKIKQLEASLFGAENQWTTFSTNTDLPELKNVGEYASSLATVQQTKATSAKHNRLKTAQNKKSTSLMQTITRKSNPISRRRDDNGFDSIPLIDDEDEEDYNSTVYDLFYMQIPSETIFLKLHTVRNLLSKIDLRSRLTVTLNLCPIPISIE